MNNFYPYSIVNRNIIESRPFDFIYDPDYSIPTKKNYNELAEDAIRKTSEREIRPIYGSMFSSIDRFPKTEFVFKTELVQITWEEKKKEEEINEFKYKKNCLSGQDLIKYVCKSNSDMPIKIRLENFNKSSAHKICINSIGSNEIKSMTQPGEATQSVKHKNKINKSTQTDYRDSETQTDPWIPPYDGRSSSVLFLKSSEQDSLVEYQVDIVDEKREICELEKILSAVDKRNLKTQIAITKKIERIEWLIKEKKIDYINSTRMELAEKLLYKKSIETRINISQREEYYRKIQTEIKNQKLNTLTKNKERELRKLNQCYTNCTKKSTVNLTTERNNFHVRRNHDIYYNSY